MRRLVLFSAAIVVVAQCALIAQPDPHRGAFTSGLGVTCAFCHEKSSNRSTVMYGMSVNMDKMVRGLNADRFKGISAITCTTCHRGGPGRTIQPPRLPRRLVDAHATDWPTSLALSVEASRRLAGAVYRNIKVLNDDRAGAVKDTMIMFDASLGVTCEYCHSRTDWTSDAKATKQRARTMVGLMGDFKKYFDGATPSEFQCYTCHQGATKTTR